MKRISVTIIISLLTVLLIAGCTAKPSIPDATVTPQASPTPVEPWKVLGTSTYSQPVNYAGFMDASFGITVGYGGEIHYSTDGGANWPKAQNNSMCRFGLDIVDSQTAWNCGNGGHVRVSTDGGKTWQTVTNYGPNEPNQCRLLSFLDATTGWAATPSTVGTTTDGGQTWNDLVLPDGIQNIMAINLRTASDGYLLDSAGLLFVTKDGGQSWLTQSLDFTKDAFFGKMSSPGVAMRFVDEKHGLIVLPVGNPDSGFRTTSAYTSDGGKTWRVDPLPLEIGIPNLYLSHDGQTLTVLNLTAKTITILGYQVP